MKIKSVELTGFKGVSSSAKLDLESFNFTSVSVPADDLPLFFYKTVFGILFGLSEEQKQKFRDRKSVVKTFTGLIRLQTGTDEFLIERDFETNFVACVGLKGRKIQTIYQGKDIKANGSHKKYLFALKNNLPELLKSLNDAYYRIESFKTQADEQEPQKNGSNIYFMHSLQQNRENASTEFLIEEHPYLFYEIFNKARDAIILWNLKDDFSPGACIEANRAACELTGYSLNELRNLTFLDLKPEAEKISIKNRLPELIEKGHLFIETQYLAKDGHQIEVEINAHTFKIGRQRVILSVIRDITQRKLFQKKILESKAKYEALFNNANDAVFLLQNQKIVECNATAINLLKFSKKDLLGKPFDQICLEIHKHSASKAKHNYLRKLVKTVMTGKNKRFNICFLSNDGKHVEAEALASKISFGGQNYVQLIIKDLTEIRQAHRALIEKNFKYQNFVENSLVGIWQLEFSEPIPVDLPATEIARKILYEGKFTEVNDALVQMYHKKDASEIIGQPPATFSIDHSKSLKTLKEFVNNNFRMDLKESIEKGGDGKQRYFNNSYFGYVEDGQLHWLWGLQIDITEQKELEEQFLQSQKMEAIGMLAGGIAHDFNNILTVINGYADMMSRQLKADNPLLKYIGQIRQAGERASNLTSQLLSFSRKQVFQTRIIELNKLISGMISMVQRIIGEHIEVITRLATDLYPVQFDESKIEQIILNLAVNAKDAMPRGGKLFIETKNVVLDADYCAKHPEVREGEYALLIIGDTGSGIDEHILKHIFEPFFTTKEKGVGTGLGLATVYGIIKQAKGHITVQSQVGQGTTFSIYLPKASDSKAIVDESEEDELLLLDDLRGNETILVVEDDPTVRQVIVETLYNHGYRVLEAIDGAEALEIFALSADQIHLIVSDIVMPRINGVEFHLQILKSNPDVKFIFISGYSDNDIINEADLDSIEFIQKPFKLNELLKRVRMVLNRNKTNQIVKSN